MSSISLQGVIYDGRYRAFRALAVIGEGDQRRETDCYWPGPEGAEFGQVARGLAHDAFARIG
ncbi:hypothetical protein HKCCE2091_01250 [Rhodobacterales bacterium HKCCE2091]|nr:hypothetical protein [Rhodobacterales bacterium HKCCE2091]